MTPAVCFFCTPFDHHVVAIIACLLSQVQYVQSSICYDKTGVQTNGLYPCQSDAAQSACCSPGDICYSSGLCAPGPIYQNQSHLTPFYWDGCSDPNFAVTGCFSNCFHVEGNGVQSCPTAGPDHYCCYGFGGCNCSDPEQVFSIPAATILTTIDPAITAITSTSTKTTTSSTISTSSGSTSTTPTSAASMTGSSSPTSTTSPSNSSNNGVAIGVGVGVGIPAAIAIVALIFFLMRRRKRKAVPEIDSHTMDSKAPAYYKNHNQRAINPGHPREMEGSYQVPELHASPVRNSATTLGAGG